MKRLLCTLFLLIAFASNAQLGYLGRRTSFSFGLGTNYMLTVPSTRHYEVEVDDRLVLPKLSFGLQRENKKGRIVRLEGTYQQLPDLRFIENTEQAQSTTSIYSDETALIRSSNIRFLYGLRVFRGLAPLGIYNEFRLAVNYAQSQAYYSSKTTTVYPGISLYEVQTNDRIYEGNFWIPEIGYQFGGVIPLNKRLALDIGGAFNINLGWVKRSNQKPSLSDEEQFQKLSIAKRLTQSNLFELHINLLIFQ